MSEDTSISETDIDREVERATQMLRDARRAREVDISTATIINRLYYACFHAAQAALYARGINPQSHGHVQTALGQEFIQPGVVAREHGRFLNDMETYRRRVDYGSGSVDRDIDELLRRTESFVTTMRTVVSDTK